MTVIANVTRNGVDTEKLFATLDLIEAQPELAKFQFRATNRWINGAHNRSTIKSFYAAGGEDTSRTDAFQIDAGEPGILLGSDMITAVSAHLYHHEITTKALAVLPFALPETRRPIGVLQRTASAASLAARLLIDELHAIGQL